MSKHPEEFGKGFIEGVARPVAGNNASAAGTLAPMLFLRLPANATATVMLAALASYEVQAGPTLSRQGITTDLDVDRELLTIGPRVERQLRLTLQLGGAG